MNRSGNSSPHPVPGSPDWPRTAAPGCASPQQRPRAGAIARTGHRGRFTGLLELALWIVGVSLMTVFLGATAWGESARQRGIATFAAAPPTATVATGTTVIAVLRIPGIKLEVPVGYGTDESVLRRGAGLVEGTAVPGTRGNVAIAGHRDTFFRGLQDVAVGDLVELETSDRRLTYRITTLSVVEPTEVQVLADGGESVLTLVTCYPFHFVGNAPQRFIVRAAVADAST